MFYTYVDRRGDKIFHRFVDDEGKRGKEVVRSFDFDVFLKSNNGEYTSLDGNKLRKVTKGSISELNSFLKEMEGVQRVYGMTDPVSQFIAKKYPDQIEYDLDKFKTLIIDIETRFDGYEPEDECQVRMSFSNNEETRTVQWVRDNRGGVYEVYDKYNSRWYPISNCPQLQAGGFPDPERAEYEVTTISLKRMGTEKTFVIGTKDFTSTKGIIYIRKDSEEELLKEFISLMGEVQPDIVTGWNVEGFDIPYLINRIEAVLGEGASEKLSPFHRECSNCIESGFSSNSGQIYKILGLVVFDYMVLYKAFNPDVLERYSLDFVLKEEGVGSKVDYSEYRDLMELYEKDYDRFVRYNAEDSIQIENLDKKKQFIRLAVTTVLMTKSRYSDVFGKVKMWDNLIYNLSESEGKVIPPPSRTSNDTIIGAFVKEPTPGFYRWIVSLDLTSLYPSIAMMFNMSPETMVSGSKGRLDYVERLLSGEDIAASVRANGNCMTANGAVFRQDFQGVIPRAMRYVFDTRKAYKKKMLAAESEREAAKASGAPTSELDSMIATYNAAQGAMKVLANSGYGCLANAGFRYFDHDIAEGITLTGQLGIRYIGDFVNSYLNEKFGLNKDWVITSDTDSLLVFLDQVPSDPTNTAQSLEEVDQFVANELQPAINSAYERLASMLGANENLLDMKREAIADVGFFRGKKNYAMELLDNEGVRYASPKIKIKGLEPVRSDRPMKVREALRQVISICLRGSVTEVRAFCKKFEEEFESLQPEEMASPKGMNGLGDYSTGTHKAVPGHVRAAMVHNNLVDKLGLQKSVKKIRDGDKIKVLELKHPNPVQHHTIGFVDKLPEEFDLMDYVNVSEMFKKSFKVPLESYCNAIGWKLEQPASLF